MSVAPEPDELPAGVPDVSWERGKSPRRGMCSAILFLEAISLGLTTPVLISLSDVGTGTALAIGLGLMVVCLLLAGMLRREWAYAAGFVVQAAAIALGVLIHLMFVLGAVFAVLWAAGYFLGRQIEKERAAAFDQFDAEVAGMLDPPQA